MCCRPRDGLKDCLPFTANGLARDDGNKNLRSAARHQVWASKAFGALNVKSRVNAFTTNYGRIVDKRAGLLRVNSWSKATQRPRRGGEFACSCRFTGANCQRLDRPVGIEARAI